LTIYKHERDEFEFNKFKKKSLSENSLTPLSQSCIITLSWGYIT